jgi:lipoic acid synthetase
LEVLKRLKDGGMKTKSGVMLGLGESHEEVLETMEDLRSVGVDILTLGQYLQPTKKHLPVAEFITPERFKEYETLGLKMGFRFVESGPLVRSSYHAEKHIF